MCTDIIISAEEPKGTLTAIAQILLLCITVNVNLGNSHLEQALIEPRCFHGPVHNAPSPDPAPQSGLKAVFTAFREG